MNIGIMGAAPNTGNLGVNALSKSIVTGIATRLRDAKLTLFDYGRGVREVTQEIAEVDRKINLCGLSHTRRYYRPESLTNMRISAFFGGLGNPGVDIIRNSDAVLDISGGDSFTDLYGKRRFHLVAGSKSLVLSQRRPLILLPQTYGPFLNQKSRAIARDIVSRAAFAFARDERSYSSLQDLLGDNFDRARHQCGVDVAFLLPTQKPSAEKLAAIADWLQPAAGETIGINVSGLIFNNPDAAIQQYGFRADYREVIDQLLHRILRDGDANILLVPHVLVRPGSYESDVDACTAAMSRLPEKLQRRVRVLPAHFNESEIKWVIAGLSWFCGTRMHSTIASLSSGVATAAIAYSIKTLGVFETCGQGEFVVDPRHLDTDSVVHALYEAYLKREVAGQHLRECIGEVIDRATTQMDTVARVCGERSQG